MFNKNNNRCEKYKCNMIENEDILCKKIINLNSNTKCIFDEIKKICNKEEESELEHSDSYNNNVDNNSDNKNEENNNDKINGISKKKLV